MAENQELRARLSQLESGQPLEQEGGRAAGSEAEDLLARTSRSKAAGKQPFVAEM